MTSTRTVSVNAEELRTTFEFVSFGAPLEHSAAVPHENDLGLGRHLALAFVDQELSDEYDTVAGFFRRRGAYGRFKALLHARGMLEQWYEIRKPCDGRGPARLVRRERHSAC